jgi:outer membrane protein
LKKNFALALFVMGVAAVANAQTAAPSKVAIIHVQNAILATKDGQKAQSELGAKFNPRKQTLEKLQTDIAAMQDQLSKGSATMSEDAKAKLMKNIDDTKKRGQRDAEDFDAEVQQEEGKIMNQIGTKLMDVIIKYCTSHGYSMVVDVSNPQTPVLWADPGIDITNEIVKLYDEAHPGTETGASAPVRPTSAPARPTSAPARPATPPATKKQ